MAWPRRWDTILGWTPAERARLAWVCLLCRYRHKRHTAAKLRRDAGESVEDVCRFLDHSSLAVTTTYLRRLEGQEDLGWTRVAMALGL